MVFSAGTSDDTEIEYFPISPHLTRIRIHKSKQSIKPIKEIICYPLTSIETDNPPPVFSTYKRTARPSLSLYRHKPPSPPKRRSSRNNSTLRLYSKMSISPYTLYKSQPGRLPSGGIEVDSNVEYLKERLTSKLNSRLKTTRRRETSIPKVITSKREHISRTGSLSPSIRTSVLTTSQGTGKVTKPIIETKSLRSRRDQLTPTRLVQGSDLRAPTEVKKVLKEQEAKESSTSKSLPSSTVVKSSTTLYSSARSSKKPKEDKSLKVSVAISSKGKELLRTSSTTSNKNLKESTLEPKKVERVRTVPSPIPKTSSVKSRTSSRADSDKRPSSRSTSRETVNSVHSTKQLKTSPGKITLTSLISVDQNKKVRKIESTTELSKKKKSKQSSSDSKPITIIKNLTSKKTAPDSNSDTNGKKRTKKVKENSDSPGSTKKSSKKNGVKKSRDKEVTRKTNDRNITDITNISNAGSAVAKLDNVINSEFGDFEIRPAGPLQSDSFFQHLLLRNVSSPTPSNISSLYRSSSVLDKARKFNETEEQKNVPYKSEPSLRMMNVYLNHKKPVTDSKFRSLDRDGASVRSSRSQSPYYARGRHFEFLDKIDHFDKINNVWDKCSGIYSPCFSREISPDYKERSSSEPPHSSPTDESQTAQHIEFGNIENAHWDYDNLSPLHSRSPSSRRIRSARSTTKTIESIGGLRKKGLRAKSLGDTESNKNLSSIQAYSTSSLNLSNMTDHTDYQTYVMELLHSTKKSDRFRELHKFYSSLERMGELERTTSSSDLRPRMKGEEIIDYDRWKRVRMKERAEEELKVLYEKLKEDQKEKDLLFRTRDSTELKWRGERDRGLRNKEKSVEDLRHQFHKLAMEDSDIEVTKRRDLDAKKDVYKPLWRGSSVVNLANALTSTVSSRRGRPVSDVCHSISVPPRLDRGNFGHSIGSRLWSSLSMEQVNALKNQLSEIYSTVSNLKRERINRMIHGKSSHKDYEITVPPAETSKNGTTEPLHVRCHSLLTNEQLYSPHNRRRETRRKECTKADSIGSIPQWKGSKGSSSSDSTNSSVTQPLSENEKKKISMTLSQEVLERATKKQSDDRKKKKKVSASIVIPRETLGAVAAVKGSRKFPRPKSPSLSETNSPRTCYSIEMSEEGSTERQMSSTSSNKGKNDFLLVLTPKDDDTQEVKKVVDEWALNKYHIKSPKDNHVVARLVRTTSNSETESGSSEASTVIHLGSREDIQKKETFGSKRSQIFESKRTRRSREKIEDKVSLSAGDIRPFSEEIKQRAKSAPGAISSKQSKLKLSSSQSFTNLKDLFGEQKATMYATVPLRKSIPSRTSVLPSTSIENKTRSTSPGPHSSQESIIRSRSISPDPMKYYRAYLNMVKAGDVRKLRDKFESLDDLHASQEDIQDTSPPLKRIQSDPDLTRDFLSRRSDDITTIVRGQEVGDVQWLKRKYEDRTHQSRSVLRRAVSPIPLKADNRFMPHINVISKLASLQQRRSLTVPPRPEPCVYRTGTVDKIRQQFELQQEELSLLGQMYTSAPDVRELKDIAPYLECDWIAHQYPKPRSLSSPETQRSLTYSPKPRPASASPVRRHQTSSILKSQQKKRDIFANQQFDPTIHRPLYRYQPPYPMDSSHHYRPWRRDPNWWWRHVYPSTKPTVTFKGAVL